MIRHLATREVTRIYVFITNNCLSFHLWWKKNLVKHKKLSNYYEIEWRKVLMKNKNWTFPLVRFFIWKLSAVFHMKTKYWLKYFVHDCLWKQLFAIMLLQVASNVVCLRVLVTLMSATQIQPNIRATNLQMISHFFNWLLFQSFHWGSNLILEVVKVWFKMFL